MLHSRLSLIRSVVAFAVPLLSLACAHAPEPRPAPAPAPVSEPPAAAWVPGPSATDIQQVVNGRNADLRQCYLAGTFKNAELAGTVNVLFTINTQGRVNDPVDAGSSIPDPEVVSCVLEVFEKLEFASGSTTDTQVEYPVRFGQHG